MSTPEQPSTPPLTRRQLRELRNTGATPIVPVDDEAAASAAAHATDADATDAGGVDTSDERAAAEAPSPEPEQPAVPLPRAADPAPVHTAPVPDSSVDLGAAPLTRRQARQQERIRTASVPVITPDIGGPASLARPEPEASVAVAERSPWAEPVAEDAAVGSDADAAAHDETSEAVAGAAAEAEDDAPVAADTADEQSDADTTEADPVAEQVSPAPERAVLNPMFGAGLLAGDAAAGSTASSFEQLLTRDLDTTGSVKAPSALIMSHASAAPLVGPIGGTGEVLVTGTFALPEGLGSTGHVRGTADGKDIDAVLVDGELPAHSSPTPIAASAAVSTIKSSEDIIQPPVPEKGGKLMLTLAITAGVLALALVGVLVYALATGVIS